MLGVPEVSRLACGWGRLHRSCPALKLKRCVILSHTMMRKSDKWVGKAMSYEVAMSYEQSLDIRVVLFRTLPLPVTGAQLSLE